METDDEFIERLNKLEFGSQQQAIDDLNRFDVLNSAADAFDEDRAAEVFEVFKYFYRGFPINFSNFKMFRSRNVGYLGLVENERQLNYPGPNMVPDFERCNFPGQPIFYGSSNTPTTFLELDLQNKRDCVITGEYDLLEGEPLNLIVVGEIDHFRRHGRTMVNTAGLGERINDICRQLSGHALIGWSYCDAFIADYFRRTPSDEHRNVYDFTARVADLLLIGVDGIMYPSVRHDGGINIAINPEIIAQKFKLIRYKATIIRTHHGYGIYDYFDHAKGEQIGEGGELYWMTEAIDPASGVVIPGRATWPYNPEDYK